MYSGYEKYAEWLREMERERKRPVKEIKEKSGFE